MKTLKSFAYQALLLGSVFAFTVFLPYSLYVESECLGKGYPESGVTYTFQAYCIDTENENGTVRKFGGE